MRVKSLIVLVLFLAVCYGAAYLGAYLTNLSVKDWYPTLAKPDWTPSGSLIGTIWTVLYTLMAVAGWLAWLKREENFPRQILAIFLVQLALNVAWSGLFFGLRSPGLASLEIVALWVAIFATTWIFWRVNWLAGVLMIPYLVWVGFAAVLNWTIWYLNAYSSLK